MVTYNLLMKITNRSSALSRTETIIAYKYTMYCFAVMKLLMHVYIKTVQRSYPILKTNRTGFRKRRLLCDSLSNLVCYVALDQKK